MNLFEVCVTRKDADKNYSVVVPPLLFSPKTTTARRSKPFVWLTRRRQVYQLKS